MFHALLVCSEGECGELYEAFGPYEELDTLACECGCGLLVLAWPSPIERRVELGPRATAADGPLGRCRAG
jgi:hypothetical protein